MKAAIIMLLTLAVLGCTAPPDTVPHAEMNVVGAAITNIEGTAHAINPMESTFTFTGYGPGKSHDGAFTAFEGTLFTKDGKIVGATGRIDPVSVNTGIGRLDAHLKSPDFFNVEQYPEIRMQSTKITGSEITGDLTFHGVTQTITFPAEITENSISADFVISLEQFGISYKGVNDDVRIQFTLTT